MTNDEQIEVAANLQFMTQMLTQLGQMVAMNDCLLEEAIQQTRWAIKGLTARNWRLCR